MLHQVFKANNTAGCVSCEHVRIKFMLVSMVWIVALNKVHLSNYTHTLRFDPAMVYSISVGSWGPQGLSSKTPLHLTDLPAEIVS